MEGAETVASASVEENAVGSLPLAPSLPSALSSSLLPPGLMDGLRVKM